MDSRGLEGCWCSSGPFEECPAAKKPIGKSGTRASAISSFEIAGHDVTSTGVVSAIDAGPIATATVTANGEVNGIGLATTVDGIANDADGWWTEGVVMVALYPFSKMKTTLPLTLPLSSSMPGHQRGSWIT